MGAKKASRLFLQKGGNRNDKLHLKFRICVVSLQPNESLSGANINLRTSLQPTFC